MSGPPVNLPYEADTNPEYGGRPVVEVIMWPRLAIGGSPYQARAVIDSGSGPTWVPHGVPYDHGWKKGRREPIDIRMLGGPSRKADRFPVKLKIWNYEFSVWVCEQWAESSIRDPLIGRDVLKAVILTLHGPKQEMDLTVPGVTGPPRPTANP